MLNKARKAIPTSHEIWIAAGRLLEQEAYTSEKSDEQREKELALVDKTIEAGVRELRRHQVLLTREQWLKEAERCENEGALRTCEAIIKATVAMDIEEEDRLDTWTSDVEAAEAKGNIGAARAILAYALRVFPDKKSLWRKAAELEKARGTRYAYKFIQISRTPMLTLSCPGNHSTPSWSEPFITARKPKCFGSCGPKRSGWQAMFPPLVRSWSVRSLPTRRVSKSGWPRSSWKRRTASLALLESCLFVHGPSQTLRG